jgi:hypothetical protein
MRRRVMMILASAVLAGSLLATGAQAKGGGGFGMDGFSGGHFGGSIGGFAGGHVADIGEGHMGGLGADHVEGAGRMAHVDQGHLGTGRRHFIGGIYDDGLGVLAKFIQDIKPSQQCLLRRPATFESELSDVTRSYAGKGVVRYQW